MGCGPSKQKSKSRQSDYDDFIATRIRAQEVAPPVPVAPVYNVPVRDTRPLPSNYPTGSTSWVAPSSDWPALANSVGPSWNAPPQSQPAARPKPRPVVNPARAVPKATAHVSTVPAAAAAAKLVVAKDLLNSNDITCELSKLKKSFKAAVKIDGNTKSVTLGSLQSITEAIQRLNKWNALLESIEELALIASHLKTIKMMMTASKKNKFEATEDETVLYMLFQSSIVNFCTDIEMYGEYRADKSQIHPREMYQLYVPKSVSDCRNNVVHGTRVKPALEQLVTQMNKCFTWYSRHFWPNLTVTNGKKNQKNLEFKIHHPKAQITNQRVQARVNLQRA